MSVKYVTSSNFHYTSRWQQKSLDTRGKYLTVDCESLPLKHQT